MIYYVDGWMIGRNPSHIGGGFTIVNERHELVKRHTIYKNPFTNNDGELFAIAYAAYKAAPGDTIITDSQCAYNWVLSGFVKADARADLRPVARRAHKWVNEKRLNLKWEPRESNLAGQYNEKHPQKS